MHYGGKDNRRGFLLALTAKKPEFNTLSRLGLIADGDDDPAGTLHSIKADLTACGIAVPPDGEAYAETNGLRVGLHVINRQLETICLQSLGGSQALECIDHYLSCLNIGHVDQNQLEKMKCRSYLAPKDTSTLSIGVGAKQGYWNFQSPAFEPLRVFLRGLLVA
jgi:hypothetical protein